MRSWATDTEFAYDDGRLYVQDSRLTWRDAAAVLRMPRGDGFFVPLRIEGWSAPPPRELDGWDHVVEFPLPVPSGTLALASDGCGDVTVTIGAGDYRARWSGRNLPAAEASEDGPGPDAYCLQLWPDAPAPAVELKAWAPARPRDELGDLPALLADEYLDGVARVISAVAGDGSLRLGLRIAGAGQEVLERTVQCVGVVHWVAGGGAFKHAAVHASHPDLRPFTDACGSLSFRGRPRDPEAMMAALHAAHPPLYGGIAINPAPGLLEHGYGRLAAGPVSLLERYARVAAAHGVATHLARTAPGRTGLRLLDLEPTFVVAERFSAG